MNHDTEWTNEPTCPYCGHVETDAWELGDPEAVTEGWCGSCGKDYLLTGSVTIRWLSNPTPERIYQ